MTDAERLLAIDANRLEKMFAGEES